MPANVKVSVSIPVEVGGYTGQREEWESHKRDFEVSIGGDTVTLQSCTYERRLVRFKLSDLNKAVAFCQEQNK